METSITQEELERLRAELRFKSEQVVSLVAENKKLQVELNRVVTRCNELRQVAHDALESRDVAERSLAQLRECK